MINHILDLQARIRYNLAIFLMMFVPFQGAPLARLGRSGRKNGNYFIVP